MHINPNRRPETVRVQLEIVNDDGSKDLLNTEVLDLQGANRPLSESKFRYGLAEYPVRDSVRLWDLVSAPVLGKPHFKLEMSLPVSASNETGIVYQIQHVEAPAKYVIMVVDEGLYRGRPTISEYTEEEITNGSTLCDVRNYFFLDLP